MIYEICGGSKVSTVNVTVRKTYLIWNGETSKEKGSLDFNSFKEILETMAINETCIKLLDI